MGKALVTNNATTTLASGINTAVTSISLAGGTGALFPSPSGTDYFYGTLIDSSNNIEIVKVTARTTDTLTVVRAQDNTTAKSYLSGDRFELRPTAALFNDRASIDGTETLTNKTLTSPTLTTPVLGTPASGTLTNCTGLPVAGGGTGATTLTGVLKGNGTSAVTAVSTLGVADGGTGVATLTGIVKGNGTGAFSAATAAEIVSAIGSTAVTNAANVTGTVPIANGGTGQATVAAALAALGVPLNSKNDKSAAYTVDATDRGKVINATTGTWTLSVTAAATLGDGFVFGVLNSGAGAITIDPNASETIDGATTKTLAAGKLMVVYCDGSNFTTIGSVDLSSYITNDIGAGAIGSFMLAVKTTANSAVTAGSTYAGSGLYPVSIMCGSSGGTPGTLDSDNAWINSASSGTWRALTGSGADVNHLSGALFQRIS